MTALTATTTLEAELEPKLAPLAVAPDSIEREFDVLWRPISTGAFVNCRRYKAPDHYNACRQAAVRGSQDRNQYLVIGPVERPVGRIFAIMKANENELYDFKVETILRDTNLYFLIREVT